MSAPAPPSETPAAAIFPVSTMPLTGLPQAPFSEMSLVIAALMFLVCMYGSVDSRFGG